MSDFDRVPAEGAAKCKHCGKWTDMYIQKCQRCGVNCWWVA